MSESSDVKYSVVVPVYRNRDSLPELVERLQALADRRNGRLEAVFVVDGSPDDSIEVLKKVLADGRLNAQIVALSRNFGAFTAVRTGLSVIRGEYIGVVAADLQEPPEMLDGFFDALESGTCDIVLGQREGRNDPAVTSLFARSYWWLYRRLINREIPAGGIDVFGCTAEVANRLAAFRETHTSLVGLLYWIGFRRTYLPYVREARRHGKSAWTFRKKLRYLFDSIYAFTDLPIVILQTIGFFGVLASVLLGVIVFLGWLTGNVSQPGYTPLMIVILATSSAILLGLGVVGSYVARAYENSKGRPTSIVASHDFVGRRD